MKVPRFIKRIDWVDLNRQKDVLIRLSHRSDSYNLLKMDSFELDGLISLIDAIQDYAVDVMGMEESEVFTINEE